MGLIDRLDAGDVAALARLATYIENGDPLGVAAIERLYPRTGRALVIGVTGPPGAGKSSLIDRLIDAWRARDRRVAVIAVDPTSPVSGGATLGDRIRVRERIEDSGVYFRSMASRGRRGGLAPATASMIHLLDAAHFDRILVETVGVGQEEIDITGYTHMTMLLQIPGSGDGVQALKAGLLEMADIYVVNKSDLPGADLLARELSAIAALSSTLQPTGEVGPRVIRVSASAGTGIDRLVEEIERIGKRISDDPATSMRRIARAEVQSLVTRKVRERFQTATQGTEVEQLIDDVAERRRTPDSAASAVIDRLSTVETA